MMDSLAHSIRTGLVLICSLTSSTIAHAGSFDGQVLTLDKLRAIDSFETLSNSSPTFKRSDDSEPANNKQPSIAETQSTQPDPTVEWGQKIYALPKGWTFNEGKMSKTLSAASEEVEGAADWTLSKKTKGGQFVFIPDSTTELSTDPSKLTISKCEQAYILSQTGQSAEGIPIICNDYHQKLKVVVQKEDGKAEILELSPNESLKVEDATAAYVSYGEDLGIFDFTNSGNFAQIKQKGDEFVFFDVKEKLSLK